MRPCLRTQSDGGAQDDVAGLGDPPAARARNRRDQAAQVEASDEARHPRAARRAAHGSPDAAGEEPTRDHLVHHALVEDGRLQVGACLACSSFGKSAGGAATRAGRSPGPTVEKDPRWSTPAGMTRLPRVSGGAA